MLELKDKVRIKGERGRFTIMRIESKDGSLLLYGGRSGHEQWRSVMPESLVKVKERKKK